MATRIDQLPAIPSVANNTEFAVDDPATIDPNGNPTTSKATGQQVKTYLGLPAADGNFYLTPYLRYTPTNPPQEQTLQNGQWVTIRTIS